MKRALALLAFAAIASRAAAETDPAVALKPGPGLDTVQATCSGCHSLDYIVMNSVFLTPDQWHGEVAKMRQSFGAPMDDATAEAIARYLAATYGTQPKG